MIDNKKIEDAAKQHSEESYISDYFQACYKDAFMEGAIWGLILIFSIIGSLILTYIINN